jgi:long-chain fatty acid transport protein
MKPQKTAFVALLLVLGLNSLVLANGLNLNSLGTRALSMGGAFVGLADDFSAIYWNPAGIANFQKRYLGFYGTDVIPSATYFSQAPTEIGLVTLVDAKSMTKHYLSGMLTYYQPINERLVAGVGVYIPSGLGSAWDGEDFTAVTANTAYLWESRIGLVTISPAIAYKVNDQVSIGATFNINYGMFNLKRWAGTMDLPDPTGTFDLGQYEDDQNGWGFGATFGVLVKANDMLSFGATVRTPSKVHFSGTSAISNLLLLGYKDMSDSERDITWPWWIAGGVAFRPMDDLIVTADLQWTQWSALDEIETKFKDSAWSLFMVGSGKNITPLHWKDALQIRFGAEYMLYQNVGLRAGYYYDPAPAPDKTLNILLPSYDFNVLTIGIGYDLGGVVLDFGFEYFMGKEREVDFAKWLLDPAYKSAMPGTYKMKIAVPTLSVSYKF